MLRSNYYLLTRARQRVEVEKEEMQGEGEEIGEVSTGKGRYDESSRNLPPPTLYPGAARAK